jgi:phospholipid/cholesterol/gamma-HCH transport system substrate-binding protein
VDKLLVRLGEIGEDIQLLTGTLSQVLGGEKAGATIKDILRNVHDLSENLNRTMNQNMAHFDEIMSNLDYVSGDLRDIIGANKEAITETVANMRKSSEQLQLAIRAIGELTEKINQGEGTLGRLINDPEIAENLNATLATLREISDRIDRGEGSLGKLVRDEETVENFNETLTSLNRTLGLQERFKVYLGYRGEYLTKDSDLKSYVSLRIQPRPDKYYSLELVDVPKNNGDNDIKVSAQIAKRYYDLLLRGGLIESTGGFGLEYYFYDDSLKFTFEAFDFRGDPHFKFYSDYTFLKHLYITAGIDSDEGRENLFIGGGVKFLDEDLKALLGGGGASAAAAAAR